MKQTSTQPSPKYPLSTLSHALEILEYIKTFGGTEGVTLNSISKNLQISKSSVHRILDTLLYYNYVNKTTDAIVRYKLGWKLYHTGTGVPGMYRFEKSGYQKSVIDISARLNLRTTVYLETESGANPIYEAFNGETMTVESIFRQFLPLYASSAGKLFMLNYSEEDVLQYFQRTEIRRYTQNTLLNFIDFLDELKLISQRGYAMEYGEYVPETGSIAMPLRDYSGKIIAAIGVSGSVEIIQEKREQIISVLHEKCFELSKYLGAE